MASTVNREFPLFPVEAFLLEKMKRGNQNVTKYLVDVGIGSVIHSFD